MRGAANGSGITNQDGRTVIQITPYTTGTITATASKTGFESSTIKLSSVSAQSLSIVSSPTTITAGDPTYVMFTVKSGDNFIGEATVTLSGAASGHGVTNQNGLVIILVNSTGPGTITATAIKTGYSSGSTTLTASGHHALTLRADPSNITSGVPTYVTFTVISGGSPVSGATVSVTGGGISTDGMTNSEGKVTLLLNASGTDAIRVTAQKTGYSEGSMTLTH
jgi:hypothetical protein